MQKIHLNKEIYFKELANTSREFYIDYVNDFITINPNISILEIGCGEGGKPTTICRNRMQGTRN